MLFRSVRIWSRVVALILFLGVVEVLYAQSPRNYIYLFDCTKSMMWGEKPIWEPAQEALKKTIARQSQLPDANFAIVAFKDKPAVPNSDILAFEGRNYGSVMQSQVDSLFDTAIKGPSGYTNIVSALRKGFDLCNPAVENRIYLFTDGKHNCPGAGRVEDCIRAWCANHPKGTRLFYVMMTAAAVDGNVMQCLDACDDGYVVVCKNGIIPQIADIGSHITASTHELDRDYAISFSEPGSSTIKVECSDPAFDVELVGEGATNYMIHVRFVSKENLLLEELNKKLSQLQNGEDYEFALKVTSGDEDCFIANPNVRVTMKNLPPRKLSLFNGKTEALAYPEVRWHDSFLWSSAAAEQPVEIDFSPVFESCDSSSALTFAFQEVKDNPVDYVLTYNGQQLQSDGFTIRQHDPEAKLTLMFNHDAKEGKRVFALTPVEVNGIDLINGMSAEDFPTIAINMSYDNYWNPLKTFCFWCAVVIIVALLLWFLMIKPMRYPKMGVNTLQIVANGINIRKRVKNCRQVVLSSRKQSQNIFSRVFTGKVLHITNPIFTSDIRVERNARGSVRFYVPQTWGIIPTAVVRKNGNAKLKDMSAGREYTVSVF